MVLSSSFLVICINYDKKIKICNKKHKGELYMCGIIGRAGAENVLPPVIDGLKRLEYRGYDSAGLAYFKEGEIERVRAKGKITALEKSLNQKAQSCVAIGHTRWATHGSPTEANAHPHKSPDGMFYVVHNGIIENSEEIKKTLLAKDTAYESQTDTEVFAHLLEKYYNGDVVSAIAKAQAVLKGAYAFAVLCIDFPYAVFGVASGSPLMAVKCEDGFCVASDSGAVSCDGQVCYRIQNGEICRLTRDSLCFFDAAGSKINKAGESLSCKENAFDKCGFDHFMLKEIYEQADAVRSTLDSLITFGSVTLPDVAFDEDFLKEGLRKIIIVACGSAYHAGLAVRCAIEKLAGISCSVELASEFRYSQPFVDEATLTIFVSQSGETADTLASLRLAKHCGAQIMSVVNVKNSAIARESENVIFTQAGREVAVATTKAYSSQLAALYAFAIFLGRISGKISEDEERKFTQELMCLPLKIKETLSNTINSAQEIARKLNSSKDVFFIGRLSDYATACEGSLKLKEISYINSQSYPAGELKHGTISLVENQTPVIAIAGESKVFSKTLSNIFEVEARGAQVIVVTDKAKQSLVSNNRTVLAVPDTLSEFRSSLLVIPLQLISYYTALLRGCDIDQPKNLAKSVTVE